MSLNGLQRGFMPAGYSPRTYSDLPKISEVEEAFQRLGADAFLPEIGKLFLEYNMERDYGIALLHRHFDLNSSEFMVEDKFSTCPWASHGPNMLRVPDGCSLQPSKWTLVANSGGLRPYHFRLVTAPGPGHAVDDNTPLDREFTRALYTLLREKRALPIFGLTKLHPDRGDGFCTFDDSDETARATWTVPIQDGTPGVPAIWRFVNEGGGVGVRVVSRCRADFGPFLSLEEVEVTLEEN